MLLLGACNSDDDAIDGREPSTATTGDEQSGQALIARFRVHFEHEITSPTSCPVRRTEFIDLSVGEPTSWLWEYGDGRSRTEQNPTFGLLIFGEVTLTVTDADGSTSTTTRMIGPRPNAEGSISLGVTNAQPPGPRRVSR